MPLAFLLRSWRALGRYAEAASECELQLALECGFPTTRIIVNGPGKVAWLKSRRLRRLTVVIDSIAEAEALGPIAATLDWQVGVRFAPKWQVDPDNTDRADQFGIDESTWPFALQTLKDVGTDVTMLQFHLGGWQDDDARRQRTLGRLARLARNVGLKPQVIDVGGGFPQAYRLQDAAAAARHAAQSLKHLEIEARRLFTSCREVVAECGRAILAPAAVLLLRVLDVKDKYGLRFIICDGGRVNHALPSDWENHRVYFPNHQTRTRLADATVCGPTCMAWDFIARSRVPSNLRPGDFVVYDAAGAYHWPWQSCFSHPRAAVVAVQTLASGSVRVRSVITRQSATQWLALSGA